MDQRVPRLVGKSLLEAEDALEKAGFTMRVVGSGDAVTAQLPAASAKVASGSEVIVYCGQEPSTDQVSVPDFTYLSYETARIRAGWKNVYVRGEGAMIDSDSVYIVRQSIEPGMLVEPGTVVTVTLNDGTKVGVF